MTETDYEEAIILLGNQLSLDRIVNNLINNSLSHSKSYIAVALYQSDDCISLMLENDIENVQ